MQITLDINRLNKAQREHVAGFILTYPEDAALAFFAQETVKVSDHVNIETYGNLPRGPEPSEDPNVIFGAKAAEVAAAIERLEDPNPSEVFAAEVNIPAPPPPPPAGPRLVPAPPAAGAPAKEADSAGFPWDQRIHSSSHSKNANGTWRSLRGVSPSVVAEVEAELRQQYGIVSKADKQAPPPPPPPEPPTAASAVPNAPPTGPIASAAVPANDITFPAFVAKLSAAIQNNKLTEAEFMQTAAFAGVGNLTLLGQRPDLLPSVNAQIDLLIKARG
jgi:hypothetical protein